MRLEGQDAIRFAEINGVALNKFADPTEDAREGMTVEEAKLVAAEDPSLIWIDVEPLRYELRAISSRDDDRNRECLGALRFTTDDAGEAKRQADELGSGEYFGVAIVDREAGTVDFGTDHAGRPWIKQLAAVDVE